MTFTGRPPMDMTGKRFGFLTVVKRAANRGQRLYWLCECDCGVVKEVSGEDMRRGQVRSCGHLLGKNSKHGHRNTPTYKSWSSAKSRCERVSDPAYPRYGGAGITMYEPWSSDFRVFLADVGERPPGTSIDRIDNSRGYEPGNVRWADRVTQRRNQRRYRGAA